MKKILLFCLLLKAFTTNAQVWLNAGGAIGSADNGHYSIASLQDTPYVVYGNTFGGGTISLKKLNGHVWQDIDAGLSSTVNSISLGFSGSTPYVASEFPDMISVKKFNGTAWQELVPSFTIKGEGVQMIIYNSIPYIAFRDNRDPFNNTGKVSVMKYDGTNWVNVGSPGISTLAYPNFIFTISQDGIPYIAYEKNFGNAAISVKKFDGTDWVSVGAPIAVPAIGLSGMVVNGSTVYVGYNVFGTPDSKVKYNSGAGWEELATLTNAVSPSLAVYNDTLYAAVVENLKIYLKRYSNNKWIPTGDSPVTNDPPNSVPLPQPAFIGAFPYIGFKDNLNVRLAYLDLTKSCNSDPFLNITAVTSTTATISVNGFYAANGYDVQYTVKGTSSWKHALNNVTATTATISGLKDTTNYLCRVLVKCDPDASYSFFDTAEFRTGTCNTVYDVASNNTAAGSAQVPINQDFFGTIARQKDTDYYKFFMPEGGMATITLSNLTKNYDLFLYTHDLALRASSNRGGLITETITRKLGKGMNYISVAAADTILHSLSACYKINIATGVISGKQSLYASQDDIIYKQAETKAIKIFPNPAHSFINVDGKIPNGTINITDVYGRVLIQSNAVNKNIDISKLTPGIYLLNVINKSGSLLYKTTFVKY